MTRLATLLTVLLLGAGALAEPLAARDTAYTAPKHGWSLGVFNPGRFALSDKIELQAHPLVFFVSPNALVRVRHAELAGWQLTGEYGLSIPTLGMRQLDGRFMVAFFESNAQSKEPSVGWFVVPRAGVAASRGKPEEHVITVRLDAAAGLGLSEPRPTPRGTYAPLSLLLSPVTNTFRLHLGGRYDRSLTQRLRLSGELNAFLVGSGPDSYAQLSPFTLSAHVGLDVGVGKSSRFTVGAYWYNHDTHAIKETVEDGFRVAKPVRSNDFYPSIDFIWAG